MIIELKPGPSRFLFDGPKDYRLYSTSVMRQAQTDLFQYCSAYFACYPDAKSVIDIGTGGPFWSWANIKCSTTSKWNYIEGCPNERSAKNKWLVREWSSLFSQPFHLGTDEYDEMLTEINQKYIYAMLSHT